MCRTRNILTKISWYKGTLGRWVALIIRKLSSLHPIIWVYTNLNWLSLKSTQCALTTQAITYNSTISTHTNKSCTTILRLWHRLLSTTNQRTLWRATTLTSPQPTCSKVARGQVSWLAPPTSTTLLTTSTSTINTQRSSISNNRCHSSTRTTAARLAVGYNSKKHPSILRIWDLN
jgi:hypothetical protein